MPYYNADVDIYVDQEWIDEMATDGTGVVYGADEVEQLIYEVKYLHLHDDKSSVEVLEELERRIS